MIISDAEIGDSSRSAHHVRFYLKKRSVPPKSMGWLKGRRKEWNQPERVNTLGVPVETSSFCKVVISLQRDGKHCWCLHLR